MSVLSSLFSSLSSMHRVGTYALAATLALVLVLGGCDSRFEEVNSNPNEPEEVNPNLLLPNIIRSSVNTSVNTAHTTGNLVLQYTSKVSFNTDIDRYDWSAVGYWEPLYTDLRNVRQVIRLGQEQENPSYEGVGLVLKSWIFSMLTNAYGDVPYSEAIRAQADSTVNQPKYDRQEEIYKGLLSDLERANQLIQPGNGSSIQGDILYGGDLMKWKKLANSLRLRLLMRLSEKQGALDGVDVDSDFQQIIANQPVFESNADNAALEYLESRPNEWPRHTSRIGTFRTYRMSSTLTDTLKAFDDPRLSVFADLPDSLDTYVGVPNGLTDDASNEFNGGRAFQSSLNTSRYFEQPDAAKGLIMTYSEVLFLRAEAAARGWTSEDAQTRYEQGIAASMNQYGQEMPANYLSQPGVQFDQSRAMELIGKQKWIALFYTGMEGWFNWRRTGYPDIEAPQAPPADQGNENNDQIPVRFRYPDSEQALNADNYQAAVESQGPNNINTEMWLLE